MMRYIKRQSTGILKELVQQFPAILLTGPRQSGKSTLVKHVFPTYSYANLERANLRELAIRDPDYFLSSFTLPLIIDEIQYAPNLFSTIKVKIDEARDQTGRFILTGSQSFNLMEEVSDSLAGRVAVLTLLPFASNEINVKWNNDPGSIAREMIQGFYPEPRVKRKLNLDVWYDSYIQTYLERDVRQIQAVKDLTVFQRFMIQLAGRTGSLLNLADLARDTGISQGAATQWLTILEASRLIFRLPPFYKNRGKRLVKAPKIYFEDTGLLCHLIQETSPNVLMYKPLMGHLFENLVIADLRKQTFHAGRVPHFYFYRTSNGQEVDLVIEEKGRIWPLEIKLTKAIRSETVQSLEKFCQLYQTQGWLVSLSSERLRPSPNIEAVPYFMTSRSLLRSGRRDR